MGNYGKQGSPLYSAAPGLAAMAVEPSAPTLGGKTHFLNSMRADLALRAADELDRFTAEAYVRVCLPNDLALFCMTDAIEALAESGLMRQGVKYHIGRARSFVRSYQKALERQLSQNGALNLFMDLADINQERMAPHLFKLRMAVKQALDRQAEPQSNAKSYAMATHIMLSLVVGQFDAYCDNFRSRIGADWRKHFLGARLQPALSAWVAAMERLPWSRANNVSGDKDVSLAVEIICRWMNDTAFYNRAADMALEMNPDRKAWSEEMRKERERLRRGKEVRIW